MSDLIPPFDWQSIVVVPWRDHAGLYAWVVLMGFLVTLACGWVGNYLILRRMALVGDAISHSILPGIAVAFLLATAWSGANVAGSETASAPMVADTHHDARNPLFMFAGALVAGILTTLLIELIHKRSRIKQDAAIGITFSSLFAVGVILISLFADRVDLDQECVLYGEITFVPLEPSATLGGVALGPPSVLRMAAVAFVTVLLILLFYKELLVSSFDPGLAASLGIKATWIHYALMGWLSIVVVSAFESVGAILVIAMLIFPGATASMVCERLPAILAFSAVHAALSALTGLHLSLWLGCSTAGAMVVAGATLFLLAWLLGPRQGCLPRWFRHRQSMESTQTESTETVVTSGS